MGKDQDLSTTPMPLIDMGEALRRFGGNWEILHNFIHRFVELHEGISQKAWRLYHEENFAALGKLAHKLKGAAGNISAIQLKESARELEVATKQMGARSEIEALISTITQQLDALKTLAKTL